MGGWFLSRRDSTIVARHEVPCLQFGHLERVTTGDLLPRRWLQDSAQGFNPGNPQKANSP
jgi:hypothetical protein